MKQLGTSTVVRRETMHACLLSSPFHPYRSGTKPGNDAAYRATLFPHDLGFIKSTIRINYDL